MIPTYEGFGNLEDAIILPEDTRELLSSDDLKVIFPEKTKPSMVKPETELGSFRPKIPKFDTLSLAKNENFLLEKAKSPNAIDWFYKLYSKIYGWASGYASGPTYLWRRGYLQGIHVLTENLEVKHAGEVYLKTLPHEVIELSRRYPIVSKILSSTSFLHPELERNLPEFFETYLQVKKLDYSEICEKTFLPKLRTGEAPPHKDELIAYTRLLRNSDIYISGNVWVLTKNNTIKSSNEVFFSSEYSPAQNWERNKKYLPGTEFLSADYIENINNFEDISKWRNFFTRVGVKEQGSKSHVDKFGIEFSKEELSSEVAKERLGYYFIEFIDVQKDDLGYDFVGKTATGEDKYLEIKSLTRDRDIELTPNETEVAERYKKDYLLCITDGIPENPELYVLLDPVKHGRKEKVTVPLSIWKGFKLRT